MQTPLRASHDSGVACTLRLSAVDAPDGVAFVLLDADTGAELWSAKLPFAGTAPPAVYEVAGRQYIVITSTGGGRVGGPSGAGDAYVAFALKP